MMLTLGQLSRSYLKIGQAKYLSVRNENKKPTWYRFQMLCEIDTYLKQTFEAGTC